MAEESTAKVKPTTPKIECKHEGHYRNAGIFPIQSREGFLIVVVLYCEQCSKVFSKSVTVKMVEIRVPPAGIMPKGMPDLFKTRRN